MRKGMGNRGGPAIETLTRGLERRRQVRAAETPSKRGARPRSRRAMFDHGARRKQKGWVMNESWNGPGRRQVRHRRNHNHGAAPALHLAGDARPCATVVVFVGMRLAAPILNPILFAVVLALLFSPIYAWLRGAAYLPRWPWLSCWWV